MADDPAKEDFTPSRTFVNGFKAYGPFIVAGWCAFELARRKIERAYYSRERSAETASPSTATARASGLWGWAVPFFTTSDDVLLQNCGMDTLFYLRFLRLCQKLAWMGILLSAALFPIYYYGQRDDADSLFRMTLSHLNPDKDDQRWRFWATTVAMYIMSAWTCYLLRLEFIEYVRRRHEFLSRKDTMQYSVIINDLRRTCARSRRSATSSRCSFPSRCFTSTSRSSAATSRSLWQSARRCATAWSTRSR
ncbi:hypothetical protein PINS_up019968 [Pythium insidiosum]|nr:hypothetical protein PINS_up019968 [Pythium insidiosum]